jgi:hypothetical protein
MEGTQSPGISSPARHIIAHHILHFLEIRQKGVCWVPAKRCQGVSLLFNLIIIIIPQPRNPPERQILCAARPKCQHLSLHSCLLSVVSCEYFASLFLAALPTTHPNPLLFCRSASRRDASSIVHHVRCRVPSHDVGDRHGQADGDGRHRRGQCAHARHSLHSSPRILHSSQLPSPPS